MIKFDGSPRLQRALLIPHLVLAWLALIVVVGWLLGHVTRALLILVLAALIAFALTPLINLLARRMPRAIAIAAAYLVGFVVILALLRVVVVTAATELSSFVGHLPAYQRQAAGIRPAVLSLLRPFGISRQPARAGRGAGSLRAAATGHDRRHRCGGGRRGRPPDHG